MRAHLLLPAFLLLGSVVASPQSDSTAKSGPGFSIDNIDKTLDPCVDFYQYACGNWLKTAEIPAGQSSWVSFVELDERNLLTLRGILEKASINDQGRTAIEQKIGDFYGSCMDEKTVNAKGLDPLRPELDRIAAVSDKPALMDAIARVHLMGDYALFNFYSNSDFHNADAVIAYLDQGGLSLPDRDYYIKDDAKKLEVRKQLVEYSTQVFILAGQSSTQAAESAQTVLNEIANRVRAHTGPVSASDFSTWLNEVKEVAGVDGKELFDPIRIALTGTYSGPDFDKLIPLIEQGVALELGIPSVRQRLDAFIGV